MRAAALALAALLPCCALAADPWDRTDAALGGAALALTLADWRQTYIVAKHPHLWNESNPAMGRRPDVSMVNGYFAIVTLAGAGIAHALPSPYRKAFLATVTVIEFRMLQRGYALGVRLTY